MKTLTPRRPAAGKRTQRARTATPPAAQRKSARLTGEEMMRELDRVTRDWPPMDTKAFLDDGE